MGERRQWVVDVCRFCGRLAVWPGCEHWQSAARWTEPVVVSGMWHPAAAPVSDRCPTCDSNVPKYLFPECIYDVDHDGLLQGAPDPWHDQQNVEPGANPETAGNEPARAVDSATAGSPASTLQAENTRLRAALSGLVDAICDVAGNLSSYSTQNVAVAAAVDIAETALSHLQTRLEEAQEERVTVFDELRDCEDPECAWANRPRHKHGSVEIHRPSHDLLAAQLTQAEARAERAEAALAVYQEHFGCRFGHHKAGCTLPTPSKEGA